MSFGHRLANAFGRFGQLCVGVDPHPYLLKEWGLTDDGPGVREFGLRVVEAAAGRVGVLKPQVAFFERLGSAGFAALEEVMGAARAAGLIVIADAKRGDIGSSVDAYGTAWLTPGGPLEADAMTIVAYQGTGSIAGPRDLAAENDKGLFVLAATSNPEAAQTQRAIRDDGKTVAAGIVSEVREWNAGARPLGAVGLVVGATVDLADYGFSAADIGPSPVLSPGFGHQGARFGRVRAVFAGATGNVLLSSSRSILSAGPDGIAKAIARQSAEVAEATA